jgi:peptidyl-prolyl cis-trans isomerase SurA
MKLKRIWIGAVLLLTSFSLAGQVASHAPRKAAKPAGSAAVAAVAAAPAGKPVARVNGTVLTDRDLLRQELNMFPYARQHGGNIPKEYEAEIRKHALRDIVFDELVYQEALRRKLTVPPAQLKRAIADFKKQFASPAEFQRYMNLEQQGSLQKLRANITRAILIDKLVKIEIDSKKRVTDAQMRTFYSGHPERFRRPETVTIQTISLTIPPDANASKKAEIRARAELALKQANATKNYEEFGVLAEQVSQDDWRVMMGDHKELQRGHMPGPVEKVIFSMKAGEISGIIDTGDSFCIARVNAHQPAHLVPLNEVKAQLKQDMEKDKVEDLRRDLEARLRKTIKVEEL